MIQILTSKLLTPKYERDIHDLFKQLSPNKKQNSIKALLSDPNNSLIFACYFTENKITGIASMCTYKVISGYKGWIEYVVVDTNNRGLGIGKKIITALINYGKELELSEIYLFTEEEKKAAIHLYEQLDFKQKHSRLYNLKLK